MAASEISFDLEWIVNLLYSEQSQESVPLEIFGSPERKIKIYQPLGWKHKQGFASFEYFHQNIASYPIY